jgi:hypothetical protein
MDIPFQSGQFDVSDLRIKHFDGKLPPTDKRTFSGLIEELRKIYEQLPALGDLFRKKAIREQRKKILKTIQDNNIKPRTFDQEMIDVINFCLWYAQYVKF